MDTRKLLRSLEWAGQRLYDGTTMGSGIEGAYPACPSCQGVKPFKYIENEYLPEAISHRHDCMLRRALDEET